jgi:lipopolysaccharide transport system permease protein
MANLVANYVLFLLNCTPMIALYLITAPDRRILAVLFPLIGLAVLIAAGAARFFIAAISVYVKDVQNVLPLLNAAILFLNPIFFPLEALPSAVGSVMRWISPIAAPIEVGRSLLFGGGVSVSASSLVFLIVWPLHMVLAIAAYRRLSKGFADVL